MFIGQEEKLREGLELERKQKSMVKSFEEKDSKIRYRGKKEEKL